MKKLYLGTLSLIVLINLTGCMSSEDKKMHEFMKCSIVADQMGDNKSVNKVQNKMKSYLTKHQDYFKKINNINAYFMKLSEDVRNDDLGLYKLNSNGKLKIIYKTYNSSECQELYK